MPDGAVVQAEAVHVDDDDGHGLRGTYSDELWPAKGREVRAGGEGVGRGWVRGSSTSPLKIEEPGSSLGSASVPGRDRDQPSVGCRASEPVIVGHERIQLRRQDPRGG
jgi:hypothetical protein